MKIVEPGTFIIEQTAADFATTFFEAARSSGMKKIHLQGDTINLLKFKNDPRKFGKAHFEKFIPAAVHALNEIMCNPKTAPEKRELIYKAIMERTNDEGLDLMAKTAGVTELQSAIPYKPDDIKPKPLIINGKPFDFNSKRKEANG